MKAVRCIFAALAVQAACADAWSGYGVPLQTRSSPHWPLIGRRWLARTLHRATGIRWASLARKSERRRSIVVSEKAIANAVVKYLHAPAVEAFRRQSVAWRERNLWPKEKNECMPRRYGRKLHCPNVRGYWQVGDSCYFFSRGVGQPAAGVDLATARLLCSLANDASGQSLGHWSLLAINSEREMQLLQALSPMANGPSYWIDQLRYVDSMRVFDATDSLFRYDSNCNGLSKARPHWLLQQPRSVVQHVIASGQQPQACAQMTPLRSVGRRSCNDGGFVCELALDGNAADFNEFF